MQVRYSKFSMISDKLKDKFIEGSVCTCGGFIEWNYVNGE